MLSNDRQSDNAGESNYLKQENGGIMKKQNEFTDYPDRRDLAGGKMYWHT